MSNFSFDVTEGVQPTPLAILVLVYGGDVISAIKEESFPLVEEIIPRNPKAKPDFQRPPEVMIDMFRSSMMAKCLAEFKVKYCLPDHVELVPTNNNEVHAHRPGYSALYACMFTIDY